MSIRLYADEFRAAIFEEAPGGGEALDPNAPSNRPVLDPIGWMGSIYFHSELNYYGIAAYRSLSIAHAAVAGKTGDLEGGAVFRGQAARTSHVLVDHNLGYPPKFFCIYDGKMIPHGFPVQSDGTSRNRFVTAYATNNQIRLFDVGYSDASNLPGVTRSYQVIAFREPSANPTIFQLDLRPGVADFGRGKFRGGEPHLRNDGQGDVLWPIATSRTAAVRNGGLRTYLPNGSAIDFGNYNGGLGAPSFFITSAGV